MNRDVCEHFNPAPCAGCRRLQLANIIEQDPTTTWGYREAAHAAAAELRRLSAENKELLELLKDARRIVRQFNSRSISADWYGRATDAIARVEGKV
jgi:hypothetical protein